MQSRQGQILISNTDMLDPNFHQTLTLLVQHDDQGALGLTLNRELDVDFKELWANVSPSTSNYDGSLMLGGPCEGPLMILHNNPIYGTQPVIPNVFFTTDPEEITWLLEHHRGHMKCFTGYSGWSALQLEEELEVGSWVTAEATPEIIFEEDHANQWIETLRAINPSQATLYQNPKLFDADPNLN
ncbi:hypothetical protein KS4_05310 [Poriferisphaera corsica]|uniref:Transcriptional regulator n=1 Tax=Poriferisphaera corsica TaxID=2528020 RepID=A0A517YQJ9_9BACT|nr:YqgE/AlgH family protein [Poriferisphaera corsica]QDU32499.1 hypothetical protein KS4_05310 [Poriferisphaera corsica]